MITLVQAQQLTVAQLCAWYLEIPEMADFQKHRDTCWKEWQKLIGIGGDSRRHFRLVVSAIQLYTWPQDTLIGKPDWFEQDVELLESLPKPPTIRDILKASQRRFVGAMAKAGQLATPDSTSFFFRDHVRAMVAESPSYVFDDSHEEKSAESAVNLTIHSYVQQEKTMFDYNAPAIQVVTLIYGVPSKDVTDQQLLDLIQKASAHLDAQREATAKLRKTKMVTAMLAKLEAELDVLLVEADKRG